MEIRTISPSELPDVDNMIKAMEKVPEDKRIDTRQGHECVFCERMPFISWRGDVLFCSHDVHRKNVLGNVTREKWKSISARKRELIRTNNMP